MKKSTLFATVTIAAAAAVTLSLPTTASAESSRHEGSRVVIRGEQPRDANFRPAHDSRPHYAEARHYRDGGWREARDYRHDRGHHYGHREYREYRHEYRPVVRREYVPYDYRPVVRSDYVPYDSRPVVRVQPPVAVDGLRIRLSYDIDL